MTQSYDVPPPQGISNPMLPPGAEMRNGQVVRIKQEYLRSIPRGDQELDIYRDKVVPVIVTYDLSPAGIERALEAARNSNADFYHPEYGWITGGRKRAKDDPKNLGFVPADGDIRAVVRPRTDPTEDAILKAVADQLPPAGEPETAPVLSGARRRGGD